MNEEYVERLEADNNRLMILNGKLFRRIVMLALTVLVLGAILIVLVVKEVSQRDDLNSCDDKRDIRELSVRL